MHTALARKAGLMYFCDVEIVIMQMRVDLIYYSLRLFNSQQVIRVIVLTCAHLDTYLLRRDEKWSISLRTSASSLTPNFLLIFIIHPTNQTNPFLNSSRPSQPSLALPLAA